MHSLAKLLEPKSIAILGASATEESVGNVVIKQLIYGNYEGKIYLINPKYKKIEKHHCYEKIEDLPVIPDHVVFAIPESLTESFFDKIIKLGIKAVTIFSRLVMDEKEAIKVDQRIKIKAEANNILICGGNSMGYYNFHHKVWNGGFLTRNDHRLGNVTFISQSGSVLNSIVDAESRLDFNLVVSSGLELSVTSSDYMNYALDLESTEVIGLFIESTRNPKNFESALKKAQKKNIPVVILKIGRTKRSSEIALTHTGSLVGNDGVFQALFDKYNVIRVYSIDELAYTLMLFSRFKDIGQGGLVSILESGGEKALLTELCADYNIPLAELSKETKRAIQSKLDIGLVAENPLDAWATYSGFRGTFLFSTSKMMQDKNAAIGLVVGERGPDSIIFDYGFDFAKKAMKDSNKPVVIISNHQACGLSEKALEFTRKGCLTLDGLPIFLKSLHHLFGWRDRSKVHHDKTIKYKKINLPDVLNEFNSLKFLKHNGLQSVEVIEINHARDLQKINNSFFPLVLKTAEKNINHKSDIGGVVLNITSKEQLVKEYKTINKKIGPKTIVTEYIHDATEIILGMINDDGYGPIMLIGSGGIFAEIFNDKINVVPPITQDQAMNLLKKLKIYDLLTGIRGQSKKDLKKLSKYISNFSKFILYVGESVQEMDINPVLVTQKCVKAADILIVRK